MIDSILFQYASSLLTTVYLMFVLQALGSSSLIRLLNVKKDYFLSPKHSKRVSCILIPIVAVRRTDLTFRMSQNPVILFLA